MSAKTLPPPNTTPARTFTPNEAHALIRRAEKGDERALPELRKFLSQSPAVGRGYDFAAVLRSGLARKVCGPRLYTRELLVRQVYDLLAAVLGADPTPIERLLAERVVIGWLQVQEADIRVSLLEARPSALDLKYADAANRHYLASLRALAAVRKLPRPAVQVHITEQQVTVSR